MTNIFTKQISPVPLAVIIAVIFGIIYLVQYFSPQGQCEREARMNVGRAAAVADFNGLEEPYKSIIEGMIIDETKKCMEEKK